MVPGPGPFSYFRMECNETLSKNLIVHVKHIPTISSFTANSVDQLQVTYHINKVAHQPSTIFEGKFTFA